MGSWSQAFTGAIIVCIYSIIWWIVGGIVIIGGITAASFVTGPASSLVMLVGSLVGFFLIFFGAIASIIKVSSDM